MQCPIGSLGRVLRVFVVSLALSLCGCIAEDGRVPVYPVSGSVQHGGRPAEGAIVSFHPLDASAPSPLQPSGKVDAAGNFQLTSYESGDGAPAGKYAVTILWPAPPKSPIDAPDAGPDRLNGRYLDPRKSPWQVEVIEGSNALEPFELK